MALLHANFTHLTIGKNIPLILLLPAPTSRPSSWHHALHPEDGSNKVLKNGGILPQHYITSQPRRP